MKGAVTDPRLSPAAWDRASRKIASAVKKIAEITDRIDLLALEATIQATRAGFAKAASENDRTAEQVLDAVVAGELKDGAVCESVSVATVPADAMILDVGPATVSDLKERLESCRTLLWNGPLGAFEVSPFDAGTTEVARFVARLTAAGGLLSVAGGGDTVAALVRAGVVDKFSYVTTAGGAFLEWLAGKTLPGVAALSA